MIKKILVLICFCYIANAGYCQSGYMSFSVGGKLSYTSQFQLLIGDYKANYGLDYSTQIAFGKKVKKGHRYEFFIGHEDISLVYNFHPGGLLLRHRLERRYSILEFGYLGKFVLLRKDKLQFGVSQGLGYTNIYHQNYTEQTNDGIIEAVVSYDFPQRTVPYTVNYYEHSYSTEGDAGYTFNLKAGFWCSYWLTSRLEGITSLSFTLGLHPSMSRVLDGTTTIFDIDKQSTYNINDTFVSTKGDHLALHLGLVYYFKEQKLTKKKR